MKKFLYKKYIIYILILLYYILLATKPEFVRKLQDFEVKERDLAILEVEITSQTAEVTWRKDGVPLKPTEEKIEFVKEGTVRKLLIRSTSVHDEGEYACALIDQECTAEVTVVGTYFHII